MQRPRTRRYIKRRQFEAWPLLTPAGSRHDVTYLATVSSGKHEGACITPVTPGFSQGWWHIVHAAETHPAVCVRRRLHGQHPVTYTIPRRMPRSPLHAGRCDPTRAEWTSQPRGHSHPATHPWHGLRRACTCRADSYRHIQRPWGAGMGVCPSRPMPIPLAATRTGVARPSNPTPDGGCSPSAHAGGLPPGTFDSGEPCLEASAHPPEHHCLRRKPQVSAEFRVEDTWQRCAVKETYCACRRRYRQSRHWSVNCVIWPETPSRKQYSMANSL
ncbi:hypothetical protein C8Q77DRAFT_366025 [Trametes polyzona]|nr:hypothetical protein C8Q77DRAFT_366025 [Trametes polyzona]